MDRAEVGLLASLVILGGTMLEQPVPEGMHPWKLFALEQFTENCISWEGPMLEKFMEVYLSWEELHAGAGEDCEESSC